MLTAASAEAQNTPGGAEVVRRNMSTLTMERDGGFVFGLPNLSVAVLDFRSQGQNVSELKLARRSDAKYKWSMRKW